ncbi:MAG: amidohydrolase family protein [Acidimicrobiales bacterium]
MLVARGQLRDLGTRDLRVDGGVIVEIDTTLRPRRGEEVVDAGGNAVLAGLHDHHVHLRSAAAAMTSVDAAHLDGAAALRAALADAAAIRSPGEWLRVVRYHASIAGDLDRSRLDRLSPPGVPVRVQHRTGALWVLNSPACTLLGLDAAEHAGVDARRGLLWRRDDLLRSASTLGPGSLAAFGRGAAARGVTGFTDATPDGSSTDARDLARDLRQAGVPQRLHLMAPVGAVPPDVDRATTGPVKVLLDDAQLPSLDELSDLVRDAHGGARPVAVHCVTQVQLVLTLAALACVGTVAGDRIEHGSVIPTELIGELRRLGVTVVSQPHFVAERGDDYLREVDPDDVGSLYRLRSLSAAGVALAAGTDALRRGRPVAVDRRRRAPPDGRRTGPGRGRGARRGRGHRALPRRTRSAGIPATPAGRSRGGPVRPRRAVASRPLRAGGRAGAHHPRGRPGGVPAGLSRRAVRDHHAVRPGAHCPATVVPRRREGAPCRATSPTPRPTPARGRGSRRRSGATSSSTGRHIG